MSPSTATVATAAVDEMRAERGKPPRQTPALWVPRVDSLAEFGLMISRQLTQCRRYGGQLSVLWIEADLEASAVRADASAFADHDTSPDAKALSAAETRSELMLALARRLRSRVRGTDMVLQVGETSFAVLLLDAGHPEALLVQHRLSVALNGPYGVAARTLHARLQMGVAAFPEGGVRGADLAESARQDLRRRVG